MTLLTDTPFIRSIHSHDIEAPFKHVDIADWLYNLSEDEFKRCCAPDHITCGTTQIDGHKVAVNVEKMGNTLVVQQFFADEATPSYCRMKSMSEEFSDTGGRAQVKVVWELMAEPLGDNRIRYTNRVTSYPTDTFLEFLAASGQTLEGASAVRQSVAGEHHGRETPKFAESIARLARAKAAM